MAKTVTTIVCKKPLLTPLREACTESGLRILNADVGDPVHRALAGYENLYSTQYDRSTVNNEILRDNVSRQSLERIAFPDNTFDLVISEDVLEHVRDSRTAFAEIHRVLSNGGYHVFTVPFLFDRNTIKRVDVGKTDTHIENPEFHGRGVKRHLAYRNFGIDLYDSLREIGFETTVHFSDYLDLQIGVVDSYVFTSRKMR